MGIKNKKGTIDPSGYSMLGKIPWNYPTESMRGIKIHDMPAFDDEKYGHIPSGADRWLRIEATMAQVESEKPYKPVTQKDIDDFIAHAKEKLKTVGNPQVRATVRQLGLAMVDRMKRELKEQKK